MIKVLEKEDIKLDQLLLNQLTIAVNNGFKRDLKNYMNLEEIKEHLVCDKLYLIKFDNQLQGFASFSYLENMVYLNGIVMNQNYQKNNIFYKIINNEFKNNNKDYFALRTQNPVMFSAAKRLKDKNLLSEYFCNNNQKVPKEVINKLRIIKEFLKMNENDSFINQGTYGRSLYGSEYNYKGNSMNNLLKDFNFKSENGDSIIFIGKIKRV